MKKEQNKKYINTYLKVLIEELEDGYYKGHTTNYIMVKIKENAENLQNKIVTAKIIGRRRHRFNWKIGRSLLIKKKNYSKLKKLYKGESNGREKIQINFI